MLKLLNSKEDAEYIIKSFENSILGTRILCYMLSYGFDCKFVDFWAGEHILVARFENTFTVITQKGANFEELSDFLNLIDSKEIVTDKNTALSLGFSDFEEKIAYIYNKNDEYYIDSDIKNIDENNIKSAYQLIAECIPNSFKNDKESYMYFLSDFMHRKRKGLSRGKCIISDKIVVATAITASETNSAAIISGICCEKSQRKNGYGKRIVKNISNAIKKEGKDVYVIALNKSAEKFYEHIGFNKIDIITYITKRCNNV